MALPAMEKLTADPRKKVMHKAVRVLGAINADVSQDDPKNIAKLLDSPAKDRPGRRLEIAAGPQGAKHHSQDCSAAEESG